MEGDTHDNGNRHVASAEFSGLVRRMQDYLTERFGYNLQTAFEVEWYISGGSEAMDEPLLEAMVERAERRHIPIENAELEKGDRQFEISLKPSDNAITACEHVILLEDIITETCEAFDRRSVFDAIAQEDQPTSGLHVHISLYKDDQALFANPEPDIESPTLCHAVGGLLQMMNESIYLICKNEAAYKRYSSVRKAPSTPTHVCWGGNNRTAAVRVPTSTHAAETRHLEYRIAPADASPFAVMYALLGGIIYGLTHEVQPPEKLYGNASDPQYGLTPLCPTIEEAKAAYANSEAWRKVRTLLA